MEPTVNPYESPRVTIAGTPVRRHWSLWAVVVVLLVLALPASLAAGALAALLFLLGQNAMWAVVGLCVGMLVFTWSLTRFAKAIRYILQDR